MNVGIFRVYMGLIKVFLWSKGDFKYVHNKKASESTLMLSYKVNAHFYNHFRFESALILFF